MGTTFNNLYSSYKITIDELSDDLVRKINKIEEIESNVGSIELSWDRITGKPTSFTPATHSHTWESITDKPTSLPANGGNADTLGGKNVGDFQLNLNKNINSINIDTEAGCWSSGVSDGANTIYGTFPDGGWNSTISFDCYHFTGQFNITHNTEGHRQLFYRGKWNNSEAWKSWSRIYTDIDKPTPQDIGAAPYTHYHEQYLSTSGGTIHGHGNGINFTGKSSNNSIMATNGDGCELGSGIERTNLAIRSWNGVGFVNGCQGAGELNETTVSIDCRNGDIRAKNSISGKYFRANSYISSYNGIYTGKNQGGDGSGFLTYEGYESSHGGSMCFGGYGNKIISERSHYSDNSPMRTVDDACFLCSDYGTISGGHSAIIGGKHNDIYGVSCVATNNSNIVKEACSMAIGAANDCKMTDDRNNSSLYSDQVMFYVGGGTPNDYNGGLSRKNVMRVTRNGNVYINGGSYNTTGADYAEYFEWLDGNEYNDNRLCRFVTLEGDKIRLANENDEYILGIISINPSVIGDSNEDDWNGRYEKDEYGRTIIKFYEGNEKEGILSHESPVESRLYISNRNYLPRSKRKEWSPVGLIGKLRVIDDGTCIVNDYCYPSKNGIATKCDDRTKGWRVIKRYSNNMIQVLFSVK